MKYLNFAFLFLITLSASQAQSDQQLQNLASFSKLYGYVKYFHPSDEAAAIDWNLLAVQGCKEVENCADRDELQKVLLGLFKPIAPSLEIFPNSEPNEFDQSQLIPADEKGYKVVSWQHKGIGFGNSRNIYQSARTNRYSREEMPSNSFGPFNMNYDAAELIGKTIRLKGDVRRSDGSGTVHLWLRVDLEDGKRGFFDNIAGNPIKSADWMSYEIEGQVDENASKIIFGGFLRGKGKAEFDNIELAVKVGDKWEVVFKNDFEEEKTGKLSKLFKSSIGRRGGNADYYVYSVEEQENGKYFQLRSKEKEELKKIEAKLLFEHYPKIGEVWTKDIGRGLSCHLPLALYGNKEQTYPIADAATLEQLNSKLLGLFDKDLRVENKPFRLADIVIIWNIFQHFYPYFDVAQTDWEARQLEAFRSSYEDKNGEDFLITLKELTAHLKDGHIRVSSSMLGGAYLLPAINWAIVEDHLVVTEVYDPDISIRPGDIIKSINGRPTKEVLAETYSRISAGTQGWLEYRACNELLFGGIEDVLDLEFENAKKELKQVNLDRTLRYAEYQQKQKKLKDIEILDGNIYYVNLDKAQMPDISSKLSDIAKSKGLICDLRGYPKSNHMLISHLLKEKDHSDRWMRIPEIIYPDQEKLTQYQELGWEMAPVEPHLDIPVVFIIDGRAISYAESYMGLIEYYDLATIVGQPTAGTNGNVNPFTLPGGYRVSWTGMLVRKHDDSQHHGVGILPDVPMERTIAGVRAEKDEFLEKAIEVIKSKK